MKSNGYWWQEWKKSGLDQNPPQKIKNLLINGSFSKWVFFLPGWRFMGPSLSGNENENEDNCTNTDIFHKLVQTYTWLRYISEFLFIDWY